MAHAAPAPGGLPRRGPAPAVEAGTSPGRGRTPDVLDARTHRIIRVVVPVGLGLIYGGWVSTNRRFGGPITGWNVFYGLMAALVFAVICGALLALGPRMAREVHALLWSAFAGAAVGFLYSQSNPPVWVAVLVALGVAAGTFIAFFYRYYTREDAAGHRIR
ncbi:hypothetical protein ACFW1F_04150 [Streptomyces bungoensis]|uniref:hypothetical protein n=1 Tax=Streptomyces bungoensis TaxID=285568 RepID=UPI0034425F3E